MSPDRLRISLAQMRAGEDVAENLEQIHGLLNSASEDSHLVCFPENALFLRVSKSRARPKLDLGQEAFCSLSKWCDSTGRRILLGSVPLDEGGKTYSSTVLFEPGKCPGVVYRKIHLFDVDIEGLPPSRESDDFSHGRAPSVIEVEGFKLGLSICYDLRFSSLFEIYAREEVDVILVPAAFTHPTGLAHWETLLRARAIECQAYVAAPAQGGIHQSKEGATRRTFGHTLAFDPWGESLGVLGDEPGLLEVEARRDRLKWVRSQIPMAGHRRSIPQTH